MSKQSKLTAPLVVGLLLLAVGIGARCVSHASVDSMFQRQSALN